MSIPAGPRGDVPNLPPARGASKDPPASPYYDIAPKRTLEYLPRRARDESSEAYENPELVFCKQSCRADCSLPGVDECAFGCDEFYEAGPSSDCAAG